MHEVLRLIEERVRSGSRPGCRTDGARLVLSIEGGGMRGAISAGMALTLHELGLVRAFDAVYGSSAGALNGAWLVSSTPQQLRGWTDPDSARTLIRWSALLRGRPIVDVRGLVEVTYQTRFPMDFGSVLASDVEYHPLATDAETGQPTDLRPLVADPAELRLALRASASLPFLAGPPVELRGRRFYDAGVAESVPFRTPLAQGATHVVVLRSRRPAALAMDGAALPLVVPPSGALPAGSPSPALHPRPSPSWSLRLLTRTALRSESPELRVALLTRGERTAADMSRIAMREADGGALTVFPPVSSPPVSRLTTDGAMLAAAFRTGREIAHATFGPLAGGRPRG